MFSNGSWIKVWKIEKGAGNYYLASMSSSKKNDKGEYEQDWADGRVRLVGTAAKQAESIKDGDRMQIESCGVTNKYDKEKKTVYTNYVVFAFAGDQATNGKTTKGKNTDFVKVPDNGDDGELPFN